MVHSPGLAHKTDTHAQGKSEAGFEHKMWGPNTRLMPVSQLLGGSTFSSLVSELARVKLKV